MHITEAQWGYSKDKTHFVLRTRTKATEENSNLSCRSAFWRRSSEDELWPSQGQSLDSQDCSISRSSKGYSPTFCKLSEMGINLSPPLNTEFQLLSFFPGQIYGLVHDLVS